MTVLNCVVNWSVAHKVSQESVCFESALTLGFKQFSNKRIEAVLRCQVQGRASQSVLARYVDSCSLETLAVLHEQSQHFDQS
jgi:hypothetical protein